MVKSHFKVRSCNKKNLYQARTLFTPDFDNNNMNGILLIQVAQLNII